MNSLQLVKSESFGEIQADIYSNGKDMFMTTRQLYECLDESKGTFDMRISRNPYLKEKEFSVTHKMLAADGKQYNTRVFTEDGIYEITMLSDSPKAKEFRAWIRKILKALRVGEVKLIPAKRSLGETNSAARIILKTLTDAGMPPEFRAVALKSLYAPVGVDIPLQGITTSKRTYDATTIAENLGMLSKKGRPHGQAVSAIISLCDIADEDKVLVPFQSAISGHSGETVQYSEKVVSSVSAWLERNDYPAEINANGKRYKVAYQN